MTSLLARQWRALGWPRLLLVALAALFIGSAVVVPQWNPVTRVLFRFDPTLLASVGQGWSETAYARTVLTSMIADDGEWPSSLLP